MFVQAVAGANSLILLCTAYVTDLITSRNRAAALSLNMAAFGLAFAVGPGIGGAVGTVLASLLSAGGCLADPPADAPLCFGVTEPRSQGQGAAFVSLIIYSFGLLPDT